MKKVWLPILVIVLVVVVFLVDFSTIKFYHGKILRFTMEDAQLLTGSYSGEAVELKLVRAEGKYVMKFSALTSDYVVIFGSGKSNNYYRQPGSIMNEATEGWLHDMKILVYHKKGFYLKPVKAFSIGQLTDIPEYPTIEAAREALNQ